MQSELFGMRKPPEVVPFKPAQILLARLRPLTLVLLLLWSVLALIAVLRAKKIAGAGLDVFDTEPLPVDHPMRKLDNVVLTPHLGYVSEQNYRAYFGGVVDDIRGFLDGKPVRVLTN